MGEIDFVVLKINGVSVQNFSEEAALQAFLKNNDPIQIEVQQRKSTLISDNISSADQSLVLSLRRLSSSNLNGMLSKQSQQTQTTFIEEENDATVTASIVAANNERLIEQEHVLFDQCLAPEIDIEEVTLRKSNSNELLGLSIIYSGADSGSKTNSGGSNNGAGSGSENNNDICTEVYISHIQDDSVAGRDGRLRQGDQILQINGKDIKTKEETETLIAENNNAVTLLVSRYLYTDEDDFNDPSLVVDLEVEEVGDENDETDEEEEDEGDELYVENNSAYENCLTSGSMNLVNNLDSVLVAREKQRTHNEKGNTETNVEKSTENNSKIGISIEKTQVENRSNQKENMSSIKQQVPSNKQGNNVAKNKNSCNNVAIESDTEHIYETIPEDSETEPFYCSPYESSTYVNAVGTCSSSNSTHGGIFHLQQRQKQRVAQWLGLCATPSTNTTLFPRRTIPMRNRNCTAPSEIHFERDTVRSIITVTTNGSSSSGCGGACSADVAGLNNQQEEQENSSSAYNTGGSNNSANQARNEHLFLTKTMQEETVSTPLSIRALKKPQLYKDKDKPNPKAIAVNSNTHVPTTKSACSTRTGCEELLIPDTLVRMYPPLLTPQCADKKHSNKESGSKPQLTQAEHLPRAVSMLCPHFTAPNLRQYHFVSSQEVSTLQPGTAINYTAETSQHALNNQQQQQQPTMVWKVKRRPDGTRYIVRRPAVAVMGNTAPTLTFSSRGRGYRHLEHTRNDPTTTEDDTISEVKTGRYWSKEERKKHVERARERRQQQQQQYQQQQIEQQMLVGTLCNSEKILARLQQHRKNRQKQQIYRVQQQDLQFGGSVCNAKLATCDLQPTLGIKQQAATMKPNFIAQQQQFILLSPNDNDTTPNTNTAEGNDFSENCSSP